MSSKPRIATYILTLAVSVTFSAPVFARTAGQAQSKPPDPQAQAKPPGPQAVQPAPQTPPKVQAPPAKPGTKPVPPVVPTNVPPPPPDYVIGPDDVLQVMFWREEKNSAEVVVRPDGMISLPMLNDVQAGGLTPEQLRVKVTAEAKRFIVEPEVSVIVKTINSRKVFITGQVHTPGAYPLGTPTTVLQLIALAGGLGEFAKQKDISIMRVVDGKPTIYRFNYKDVTAGKNLAQNILLKPGDTVIVP
jgi:polysaccharide export outer membrane protein